jgi:hypothetical protein
MVVKKDLKKTIFGFTLLSYRMISMIASLFCDLR